MRVVALVHMHPALGHQAGAEWMLHYILRDLAEHGHDVICHVDSTSRLRVRSVGDYPVWVGFPRRLKADVVITHLDETLNAMRLAAETDTPIVHIVHNDHQLRYHAVGPDTCALAVFNSRWLKARTAHNVPSIVCHPPVLLRDYLGQGDPNGLVTLVNLSPQKGAQILYDLAAMNPQRRFAGVVGAYGNQINRPLPNVEVIPQTRRIVADVYARTRVLLMPSTYESWGRCAAEAAMSGIPVIASATPGLRECLTHAGTYLPMQADSAAWSSTLAELDDPDTYAQQSAQMLRRGSEIDAESTADLDSLRAALERIAEGRPAVQRVG